MTAGGRTGAVARAQGGQDRRERAIGVLSRGTGRPVLRGRRSEMVALGRVLTAVRAGTAGLACVVGEPGIGKTRLLDELADRAAAQDLQVLSATSDLGTRRIPLSGLSGALPPGVDAAAAVGLLLEQARRTPMVLIVDDIHWADGESVHVLRSLVRQRGLAGFGLVVASRPLPPTRAAGQLLDEIAAAGLRVDVTGLSPATLASCLQDLVPGRVNATHRAVVDLAQGNPQLLRMLVEGPDLGDIADAVAGTGAAAGDGGTGPALVRVLESLALLGAPARVHDLAAVAGEPVPVVVRAVREARRRGLVTDEGGDTVRLVHALVGEAVLAGFGLAEQRAMHRHAALSLQAAGASADVVAAQLAACAVPGDADVVAALRQCSLSYAQEAPRVAAEMLETALSLHRGDPGEHDRIRLELAEARRRSGHPHAAEEQFELLATACPDAAVRGRALRSLVELRLAHMNFAGVRAALRQVEQGGPLPGVGEADLDVWRVAALADGPRDLCERACSEAVPRLAAAGATGHIAMLHFVLMQVTMGDGDWDGAAAHAGAAAHLARSAGDPRAAEMAAWEALMLGSAGRTGPAARILDALEARGEQRIQLEVMLVRIALHIRSGHWDRAQALHRQVLAQGPAQPLATAFHAFLASVLARGAGGADLVAAAQALLTASEPVLDDPADEDQDRLAVRLVARCNVLLAQGRPADAADAVRELLDDVRRTGRIGNLVKGGADHVAVLLEDPSAPADAHRQAGEVTEMLRRMDRRLSTPVSRLHVAYAEALLADDPGAFAAAAADPVLDTVRDVAGPLLERAAACAARHDRPEQALSALRAALDLYESLPAPASAARVRAALRGAGVRVGPRGPRPARPTAGLGSLTPAERRVALLVADGLTNQAVADRLHVSRGTVATQLASAFRKLGVRGRVELALAVAELAPGPPDPDRP